MYHNTSRRVSALVKDVIAGTRNTIPTVEEEERGRQANGPFPGQKNSQLLLAAGRRASLSYAGTVFPVAPAETKGCASHMNKDTLITHD